MSRTWKWIGSIAIALLLPIAAAFVLLDASHVRGTLVRIVTEKTGRALAINGDLQWKLDWPRLHLHATDVTFANPPWAREKQMLAAAAADVDVDLPRLFMGTLFLSEVELDRSIVYFEVGAEGRKNWLLDPKQQNEKSRAWIGRLRLREGRVSYDDPIVDTSIVAELTQGSGTPTAQTGKDNSGIAFKASGKYLGLRLAASGSGGSVLGLRDEHTAFPMTVAATLGPTSFRVEGTMAGVLENRAVDVNLALRGESLAELFDVLAIPLPETNAYSFAGRLTHREGAWVYQNFSGRIGHSDVAGSLHFAAGPPRPMLTGELAFKSLDLADLGPVVGKDGASPAPDTSLRGRKAAAPGSAVPFRTLPARSFRRDHWTSVDADVNVKAQTILRPKALPLEHLTSRLRMRESVLTLDPLDFGVAGGDLVGAVRLDGQHNPIRAHAKLDARKLQLAKLLPTIALVQASVGEINGDIELTGRGDSIARMLATADGKVGLVVDGGKVSKLLLEQIALHIPEIVLQHITGDELVDIRCGVAAFDVRHGTMQVTTLVLDTDVIKITGRGSVDLAQESLNLTLIPRPKKMSLFALRGPITVRGELAHPQVSLDTSVTLMRGAAAVALAAINPLLALVPLADPGSGKDSDCTGLTQQTQSPWRGVVVAERGTPP
jgi:uncharacterized protein involved in outer membrane biogenesis